jgi:ergothioneine biosynthesis protein EgtB
MCRTGYDETRPSLTCHYQLLGSEGIDTHSFHSAKPVPPDMNAPPPPDESLVARFRSTRTRTAQICRPLEIEDYVTQPVAEVSPPKWHLGHTTWFFEELLLVAFLPDYCRFNEGSRLLFNSYYKSAGKHWLQGERGNLSRPTVAQVLDYRRHVDAHIVELLERFSNHREIQNLVDIGLHHEQQHQELLFTDIKYILGVNPLQPVYSTTPLPERPPVTDNWMAFPDGLFEIGFDGDGFAYDNEKPRHRCYLQGFDISRNHVTNAEFMAFIEDGGYTNHRYWLSDGWDWVCENRVRSPLYWQQQGDGWSEFTLHGKQPLAANAPVTHVSYYEADAYARWKGCRLPTEQEFEVFLDKTPEKETANSELYHPIIADAAAGQAWCWTSSHYSPYPGYRAFEGLLEEYNGKFMCNQFVLRGGCIATPPGHFRNSYRNFFKPHQRWMFSGIRLAKDLH